MINVGPLFSSNEGHIDEQWTHVDFKVCAVRLCREMVESLIPMFSLSKSKGITMKFPTSTDTPHVTTVSGCRAEPAGLRRRALWLWRPLQKQEVLAARDS